ncbi:MAG: hypothetical protein U0163_00490, partial [Gemmatimonadaceae bacterium]
MQSDDRVSIALGALARPIAEFRSALSGALGHANAYLASQRSDPESRAARLELELGLFAKGRVDARRLAALAGASSTLAPNDAERIERAAGVLEEVLGRGEDLFQVNVEPGGSLSRVVEDALAGIGRAFGAVLAVELVRGNAYRPEHDALLHRMDFRVWTRDERRFAPPLVVTVDGADLHVGGLSDFTD